MTKDEEMLNRRIAEHYGYKSQSKMLIEECAELIQAISKYNRETTEKRMENLVEEIADVEMMIDQIKYLLAIEHEKLDSWKSLKINRTIDRMNGAAKK